MGLKLKPQLRLLSKSHQIPAEVGTSVSYVFSQYTYLTPNWKHQKVPTFSKYTSQTSLHFCF